MGRVGVGRPRKRLVSITQLALWLHLVLGVASWAFASTTCLHEVDVESVGYGVVGETDTTGTNAAVLEALATAVTRVRGAFLSVETRLVDSLSESVTDGELSIADASSFARIIEERASGLVTGFEVLSIDTTGDLVQAHVRATICSDERLALRWTGPGEAKAAFLGALRAGLSASGWQVVVDGSSANVDPLLSSLVTGATSIATVTVTSRDTGEYRGHRTADVTFVLRVESVTGGDVVSGMEHTVSSLGRTLAEAEANAARDAATALANNILRSARGASSPVKSLTLDGVRRENTVLELERAVSEIAGVAQVELVSRVEGVRFDVLTTRSMCDVATDLTGQRRMLIVVESCDDGSALARVMRE